MGWVWSDELAVTLRNSPEFASLIPSSWTARPAAFATLDDESPVATVRRLLGLRVEDALAVEPGGTCFCGAPAANG